MKRHKSFYAWLSLPLVAGLAALATPISSAASPTVLTGSALYQKACAYCHGSSGQGGVRQSAPKLWGRHNTIQGGAYSTSAALGQFIKRYMPLEPVNGINPGSLTQTQAQSVARYILSKQRR